LSTELYIPKPIPRMTLREQAEWLVSLVRRYPDLDTTRSSRFSQMSRAILADGPDIIRPDRADFPATLQAIKDLCELHFVLHVLEPIPNDTVLWAKVREVFGDAVLPSKSNKKSGARNIQFEVFSRAILARAGMNPEPLPQAADFRCRFGQWAFAVESKRVTSLKKLRSNISEAGDQTFATGLPGILFVDYSEAVNPGDKVLALTSSTADFGAAQTARHKYFWSKHADEVRSAIRKKSVLAIVFFDHLLVQSGLSQPGVGNWELATIRDNLKMVDHHSQIDDALEALNHVGLPRSTV
jgi:hypothetical protein